MLIPWVLVKSSTEGSFGKKVKSPCIIIFSLFIKLKQDNKETLSKKIEEKKEAFEDKIKTENLHRKSPGKDWEKTWYTSSKASSRASKGKSFIYKKNLQFLKDIVQNLKIYT